MSDDLLEVDLSPAQTLREIERAIDPPTKAFTYSGYAGGSRPRGGGDLGLDEEAIVCFPGGCQTQTWEGNNTMAEEKMALLDVLRKGEGPGGDVLVEGVRWLLQELMDAEVSAQIGAGRYERNGERTTQRNGYRSRPWDTRVG